MTDDSADGPKPDRSALGRLWTNYREGLHRRWTANRGLRFRRRLDRYFVPVVVLVVILIAVGMGATYAIHVDPATETHEQIQLEWSEEGTFSHEATVMNATPVFDAGETLSNRQTYYTRVTPELDGTYEFEYVAPNGTLNATVSTMLVIRSTSDGEIHWESTDQLDTQTVSDLEPGETTQADFQINITEIESRIDAIEESLGGSTGSTEVLVIATVETAGTVAGQPTENTHTSTAMISPGGSTYGVSTDEAYSESHRQSTMEAVPQTYGLEYQVAGPLMILFGIGVVGLLGGLRYRGAITISAAEQRSLEHHQARGKFDEWITAGRARSAANPEVCVETTSLEGLVDVAIDTNSRVIEDASVPIYYVVNGTVRYVFRPDQHHTNGDLPTQRPVSGIDESVGTDAAGPVDVVTGHAGSWAGDGIGFGSNGSDTAGENHPVGNGGTSNSNQDEL